MTCECISSDAWTAVQRSHADQIAAQVLALVTAMGAHQGMCEQGVGVFRDMVSASVTVALRGHGVPPPTVEAP